MSALKSRMVLLVVSLFTVLPLQAEQALTTDPVTGAETRTISTRGVTFALTQLLPDQVRAFYVNRGFTLRQAEAYASACVFMTVLRNDKAEDAVHYVLQRWSVISEGQVKSPMKVDDWIRRLAKEGVKKSALIAFRWAQFPPEQLYEPGGDWNQGMLTTGLPAGRSFDMVARWDMGGEFFEGILRDVRCAK